MRIAQSIPRMSSFFKRHVNQIMIFMKSRGKECAPCCRYAALKLLKGMATNGFVRPSMRASDDSPEIDPRLNRIGHCTSNVGTSLHLLHWAKGGAWIPRSSKSCSEENLGWISKSKIGAPLGWAWGLVFVAFFWKFWISNRLNLSPPCGAISGHAILIFLRK